MLDKKDAKWWILEAEKHPDKTADLIRLLAERLTFLDRQNEELRGELIALQRKQRGVTQTADGGDLGNLHRRVQELESALRQSGTERQLIVYSKSRIEANLSLNAAQQDGVGGEPSGDASILVCSATAKLLVITGESRAFSVGVGDLPVPTNGPAIIENPRDVVAILDQAAFDQCRYLTLVTERGYAYSLLAGTIARVAARQEKLVRNLIPDDPIKIAIPSNNADLFAVSRKGRWLRFPEKAIAGTGSQVMELPKGDKLAGMMWLGTEGNLIFVTEDGKVFVRSSTELACRKVMGRSAGILFRDQAILGVAASGELNVLTRGGKLITLQSSALPYRAQTEDGVMLPSLAPGDAVQSFAGY